MPKFKEYVDNSGDRPIPDELRYKINNYFGFDDSE